MDKTVAAGQGQVSAADDRRLKSSGQWTVDSGQWTVDSGQWTVDS
jgi:hypothetical protein